MAMMTAYASGKITKGNFEGHTIWFMNNDLFYVVDSTDWHYQSMANIQVMEFTYNSWGARFRTHADLLAFLNQRKKYEITTSKVDRIVNVSSFQTGPSAAAFVDGALTAGIGYGAAKAMASVQSKTTLAVYMKDGKKMLIEFVNKAHAAQFQSELFIL